MKLHVCLVSLTLVAALPAQALTEVVPPPSVRAAFTANPKVLDGAKFFKGPGNLIGVVTLPAPPGQPAIIYVAPDGSAVVVGQVVEIPSGKNLTAEAAIQFAPGSQLAKQGEQLIAAAAKAAKAAGTPKAEAHDPVPTAAATPAALAKLAYIETGSGERVIYAFVDPLCKYCQSAYQEVSAWQKRGGKTRVRWVPISLGNEVATSRAAQALGDRTPAALEVMFAGTAPTSKEAMAKGAGPLDGNIAFIEGPLPITATPVFVYIDGGRVVAKVGYGGIEGMGAVK